MIELRLRRPIYDAGAVAQAVHVYAAHAAIERCDDAEYSVVRVSAATPERERRVAGELGNYALGLTVKARALGTTMGDEAATASPR
ncbi:MAG: HxsD-like protein [Polyangiaceae bacterium]|nr:HxsD-like protein [Polyangiaceae bacterium]